MVITVHLSDDEVAAIGKTPGLQALALRIATMRSELPAAEHLVDRTAIPQACSISFGVCGDRNCDHLHLMLHNQRGEPIASGSCGEDMLWAMLRVLGRK